MAAIPLSLPFLWNHWDSKEELLRIARSNAKHAALILPAGHDVLVPEQHFGELKEVCKSGEMAVQRVVVQESLHHKILLK